MKADKPIAQVIRYLSFPSQWGERDITVSGRFQFPQGASRIPCVIILHGSAGVSPRGVYYGDALNRAGIASFEVDQWGGRNLDGGPGGRPKTVAETLPDVYGAIDLLNTMPTLDARRIALLGFSWGGVVTMLAATHHYADQFTTAKRSPIAAAVAVYPVCWLCNAVPGHGFRELLPIPMRLLIGGRDDYDDGDGPCISLVASLTHEEQQRVRVICYPTAGHAFDGFAPAYAHADAMAHRGRGGEVRVETDEAARAKARDDVVRFFREVLL